MQTLRMNPSPIKKLLVLALLLTALYTSGRGQAPTSMGAGSSVGPARDSMEIRVVAALVVEKDGRISKVDIVENSCRPCSKRLKKNIEAEVLRIIQATSRMEPRKDKNGKPQVTYYKQPIIFKILPDDEPEK